ncbi:MAG TPA: ABC transporter substrate-binding protein [Candidatus Limiplasma sp.]|nr:ABC transporter substrate-binding protein [Candidatus Limiplasma sp.]
MKKILALLLLAVMLVSSMSFAVAEEKETIQVAYLLAMNAAEERDLVQDAVNERLAELGYDFQIEFVCIDFASWATQINLMLTDGSVDLFNAAFMTSLSMLADQGSLAPVDELFAQYGQGILDTLGEYIECARVGGVLYGAPKVNAFSSALMFVMDKAIADEVGIDPEAITDFDTLTEALKVVKAAYPDLTMIANGNGGAYLDTFDTDLLGTADPLGALMLGEDGESTTVVNYYESDTFKSMLEYAKIWSEEGFFMKDPLNAQDGSMAYLSNGQSFGSFVSYSDEATALSVQEKNIGKPIYAAQITQDAWATTSNVAGMTWCIPALSEHQVAATQFLNLLFTDASISNLVCNGIEGVHYVVTDEGNITFAGDLNPVTTGWPSGMGTFWPNICITYPWAPDAADVYDSWLASNETCQKSPALGFAFDSSVVSDEASACSTIVDKYVIALLLNIGDTDALYQSLLNELDAAGIDDIIAAKQAQLDAWAAN